MGGEVNYGSSPGPERGSNCSPEGVQAEGVLAAQGSTDVFYFCFSCMKTSYLCRVVCPSVCGDRCGGSDSPGLVDLPLFHRVCLDKLPCWSPWDWATKLGTAQRYLAAGCSRVSRGIQEGNRSLVSQPAPAWSPRPSDLGNQGWGDVPPGSPILPQHTPFPEGNRPQRTPSTWLCLHCMGQKFLEAPDMPVTLPQCPQSATGEWRCWKAMLTTWRIKDIKNISLDTYK